MSEITWTGAPLGTVVRTVGTTVTIHQPAMSPVVASETWTA